MTITNVIEHKNEVDRDIFLWRRFVEWLVITDNDYEDALKCCWAPFAEHWSSLGDGGMTGWNTATDPGRHAPLKWGRNQQRNIDDGGPPVKGKVDNPNMGTPHTPWEDTTVWLESVRCTLWSGTAAEVGDQGHRRVFHVAAVYVDDRSANHEGAKLDDTQRGVNDFQLQTDETETIEKEEYFDKDEKVIRSTAGEILPPQVIEHSTPTIKKSFNWNPTQKALINHREYVNSVNSVAWGTFGPNTMRIRSWRQRKEYIKVDQGGGVFVQQARYVNEITLQFNPLEWHTWIPSAGAMERILSDELPLQETHLGIYAPIEAGVTTGPRFPLDSTGAYERDPAAEPHRLEPMQYRLLDFNQIPILTPPD